MRNATRLKMDYYPYTQPASVVDPRVGLLGAGYSLQAKKAPRFTWLPATQLLAAMASNLTPNGSE